MRHDARVALTAALLVPGFRAVVKANGLRAGATAATKLAAAPRLGSPRRTPRRADAEAMARTVDAVTRRLPVQSKCLPRSLALWTMLRRAGVDATLRIGMRTDGTGEAHAWVESDGTPVGEEVDLRALATFPLASQLPSALVGPERPPAERGTGPERPPAERGTGPERPPAERGTGPERPSAVRRAGAR